MAPGPALDVLHADNHLLVVHKPAGLPVVPDASGDESLLERAKAWVAHTYDKPGAVFLGVVHRLDRPVSGVVVLARTSKAASRLTAAFRGRTVTKTYLALGVGAWPAGLAEAGELEQWLLKDPQRNRVHSYRSEDQAPPGAKQALTSYRRRGASDDGRLQLLELQPLTGRSHQLRVAARSLGLPLLGDLRYGEQLEPLPDRSIGLHARRLRLPHPTRDEQPSFEAPLPAGSWWDAWRRLEP